ncbi:unnamed protein product [Pleuronectes platessa]|uniref:Uncharacterized protein n=1 Tax=Pleuronectes platessa TaxID=8262 RepID=A0A9N7W1A4_PLEPL|nr:unnamed protein product [Pleuronectes platessa]
MLLLRQLQLQLLPLRGCAGELRLSQPGFGPSDSGIVGDRSLEPMAGAGTTAPIILWDVIQQVPHDRPCSVSIGQVEQLAGMRATRPRSRPVIDCAPSVQRPIDFPQPKPLSWMNESRTLKIASPVVRV